MAEDNLYCPRCASTTEFFYFSEFDDEQTGEDGFKCFRCGWNSMRCPTCSHSFTSHFRAPCGVCGSNVDVSFLYEHHVHEVQGPRAPYLCPKCGSDTIEQDANYTRGDSQGWTCLVCAWCNRECPGCLRPLPCNWPCSCDRCFPCPHCGDVSMPIGRDDSESEGVGEPDWHEPDGEPSPSEGKPACYSHVGRSY